MDSLKHGGKQLRTYHICDREEPVYQWENQGAPEPFNQCWLFHQIRGTYPRQEHNSWLQNRHLLHVGVSEQPFGTSCTTFGQCKRISASKDLQRGFRSDSVTFGEGTNQRQSWVLSTHREDRWHRLYRGASKPLSWICLLIGRQDHSNLRGRWKDRHPAAIYDKQHIGEQ